jgi:hypothetical protein
MRQAPVCNRILKASARIEVSASETRYNVGPETLLAVKPVLKELS